MKPADQSLRDQGAHVFVKPRQRGRWLLKLARWCYCRYLQTNSWQRVLTPSPLKGGGLMLRWRKNIGLKRYLVTTEEALELETKLHLALQRRTQ